jgi:signal transduction histidine kinase/ActR/RegA family two-component response regulator
MAFSFFSSRATIGNHLLWLALGTLLPVVLLAAGLAVMQAQQEREAFQDGAHARVVAVSSAVDAELRAIVASLRTLAESQALAGDDDLQGFHALALGVKNSHSDWVTVILADASGRQRVNVTRPYGSELPHTDEVASFQAVVDTLQPAIGSLAFGPRGQRQAHPVRVPVLREGRLAYVLTAVVDPVAISRILRQQALPDDWVASVVDARLVQVARLHQKQVQVGVTVAPAFRAALTSGAAEGTYRGSTLEGTPSYVSWRRSAFSGWTVGIAIPAASVEAGARRALVLGLFGVALALALALVLARLLARRISEPVAMLAAQARALRRSHDSSVPPFEAAGVPPAPAPPTPLEPVSTAEVGAAKPAPALRELRELQQALDDATQAMHALDKERARANTANRAKDEFLAMLGHELRNPLSAITIAAQILRTRPEGPSAVRAQGVLHRQTAHLIRLVDDLLDASRVSLGKIALERRPVDFADLVQRVAVQVVGESPAHRLVPLLEAAWVSGDDTRLEQIVTNLLSNAVRYSPAGGTITLTLRRSADCVVLAVCDEGVGMAPELLPRVFDLFVQGERGAARSQGGLGIGLTLAQRLAVLHGGTLEAHSDGEGRGSRFLLTLPAAEPPTAHGSTTPAVRMAAARRLNVLLVDDNEDGRRMLREVLESAGHQVTEAADGIQALELAASAVFGVALIDIGLPGIDGLEVARRLRQKGQPLASLPLVAITGYGAPQDHERSRAAGFDLHLVKPLDGFDVLEKLQRLAHPHETGETQASR